MTERYNVCCLMELEQDSQINNPRAKAYKPKPR